jgi:AcrR family transcriptional regulator
LLSEIGFEKTTVSDIARELQMSPANIYRFFSAKADINGAVGRRLLAAIEATGDGIVKNAASARDKLRALLATIGSANEERFLSNRKLHDLLETAFSDNWSIARDHIGKITELLGEIISQGIRDRDFAVGDCELPAILVRSASIRFWHPRQMVEDAQNQSLRWMTWLIFALPRSRKARLQRSSNDLYSPIRRFNATYGHEPGLRCDDVGLMAQHRRRKQPIKRFLVRPTAAASLRWTKSRTILANPPYLPIT